MADTPTQGTDRFGNALDPIVNYARGSILRGTDEEVARMLRARQMVAERVRNTGAESVYDLSGMNRGGGISAEDTRHLTSHVPFFERFEGRTEPLALRHMGADADRCDALILNRVSAANFIALTTLTQRGDKVYALAAPGRRHASVVCTPPCARGSRIQGVSFQCGARARVAERRSAAAAPDNAHYRIEAASGLRRFHPGPRPPEGGEYARVRRRRAHGVTRLFFQRAADVRRWECGYRGVFRGQARCRSTCRRYAWDARISCVRSGRAHTSSGWKRRQVSTSVSRTPCAISIRAR